MPNGKQKRKKKSPCKDKITPYVTRSQKQKPGENKMAGTHEDALGLSAGG